MNAFALNFAFDAVVMLTWSDWHTEPRGNRYHYATRFARHLPVFFVQPDIPADRGLRDRELGRISFEPLPGANIILVHLTETYGTAQARDLDKGLKSRGVHRPLLWIYNPLFEGYLKISRPELRIYHATEDYVTPTDGVGNAASPEAADSISRVLKRVLKSVDLLIAVSEGVAEAYRTHGGYGGRAIVLENGCDYQFWRDSEAQDYRVPADGARVALFQGGINRRLDYGLLLELTKRLPDWRFWFCGNDRYGGHGWKALLARPNVVHYGNLPVQAIAALARHALVGIIPFMQHAWIKGSLPLKAYEYVAAGLPVVSVPITALMDRPELFTIETTAAGFARAIERLVLTRTAAEALAARRLAAAAQSYDCRFSEAVAAIADLVRKAPKSGFQLNVLMLYDEGSTSIRTVYEHLESFKRYSRHKYYYMSATHRAANSPPTNGDLDFDCFDAVVIHYSVRLSHADHITETVAAAVRRYRGPKLLFIQDEYDSTETARRWIERLGIDSIYTNIPLDQVRLIYPRDRFPKVDFLPTLTGYVPDDPQLDNYALPLEERLIFLGYRCRQLPHHYGILGYEKYRIGRDMRRLCLAHGIPADIEVVADAARIFGTDWYRFVGSCRAMLGTESGSNVFDYDGSLKALAKKHARLTFEEFAVRFLKDVPNPIQMNQVSPKIFEAIRLRTALVLFEGRYSGVIEPEKHYIPLKRDYSNIKTVFKALSDFDYLKKLTGCAYKEVIEQQRFSYRSFVQDCDRHLDARVGDTAIATIVSVPVVAFSDNRAVRRWPISIEQRAAVTDLIADGRQSLERASAIIGSALTEASADCRQLEDRTEIFLAARSLVGAVARAAWRLLPVPLRKTLIGLIAPRIRAFLARL
jgi:hypothetical protein